MQNTTYRCHRSSVPCRIAAGHFLFMIHFLTIRILLIRMDTDISAYYLYLTAIMFAMEGT